MISDLLGVTSRLLAYLTSNDFEGLARQTHQTRFDESGIERAVAGLGLETIEGPPSWEESRIEIIALNPDRTSWRIRLPLWSQGRITTAVASFHRSLLPTGLHDHVFDGFEIVEDFQPGLNAVAAEEIALAAENYRTHAQQPHGHETAPVSAPHDWAGLSTDEARVLADIMAHLVTGRIEELAGKARPGGMSAESIREALDDYHDALEDDDKAFVLPPGGLPPGTFVAELEDDGWRIAEMFMWTDDGESELCILPKLLKSGSEITGFMIYDIKVP